LHDYADEIHALTIAQRRFLMKRHILIVFITIVLISCSSPSSLEIEQPPATETTSEGQSMNETVDVQEEPDPQENNEGAEPGLCEGEPTGPIYDVITRPGIEVELIYRPEFMPYDVSVGSNNRIVAVPQAGEEIFELNPDGSVEVTYKCHGVQMATVAAATDGAIWFTTRGDCSLIRVNSSGEPTRIYENGNCNIETGPNGTIYAMDNGIVRVDPDGNQELITDQVQDERKIAISPNNDIVVGTYDGRIINVDKDGNITDVATGLCLEAEPFFNSKSELFVNDCGVIKELDMQTGDLSSLAWIENANGSSIFIDETRILHYQSSLQDILVSDLSTQTTELLYDVKGYSLAFALDPEDNIYIAYGNKQQDGNTDLYKLDGDELKYILSLPYGEERAMVFDQAGFGYVALFDFSKGSAIYRFDPTNKTVEMHYQSSCIPNVLGVHPNTNEIWGDDCNDFFSISPDGNLQSFSGIDGIASYSGLIITQDNEFYTVGFHSAPDIRTPNPRFLYKYNWNNGNWSKVVDLTQNNALVPLATVTACPNGDLFILQGIDQTYVPIMRNSMNAAFKLDEDGTLKLLAFDISHDTATASCNSDNDLVFPSGGGIFKLSLNW
jgi:hypothetical protein